MLASILVFPEHHLSISVFQLVMHQKQSNDANKDNRLMETEEQFPLFLFIRSQTQNTKCYTTRII